MSRYWIPFVGDTVGFDAIGSGHHRAFARKNKPQWYVKYPLRHWMTYPAKCLTCVSNDASDERW